MSNSNKVLVTGGLGYIGSHTVVELINQQFEVVIIDDLSNSSADVLDGIEKITGKRPDFHQFNLCDGERLHEFFATEKEIASIIHFAASKSVGESVQKPLLYYHNNLMSLINLLEKMLAQKITNMVFSSSCTVYGQPDQLPVDESTPMKPAESPYGKTKQICEQMLEDSAKAYEGIAAIALRYFNPVGAHVSALIGELPSGVPNNLIPYITQTAAGQREVLSIFGKDYDTPDGTAIRDYIHVTDLAKAHIIALNRLGEGKNKTNYEYFNIGTGEGYSVLQAVNKFQEVNQVEVPHKFVDRRPGDVEKIYADTSYANEELGWKAELGLEEMMSSAWKWQQHLMD